MAVPGLTSLLPPIRETAAMLLFERLPDSIFAPLASANRRRYWAMLCYLHERYFGPNAPLPPSNGFNMTEIVHAIEDELLTQDAWDSEDGEAKDEPETPLGIRANIVFTRLRDTGWLRVEQYARDQMVTMRPIVSKFLDELVAFAETGPVFVSGKIRSIDLNIQQVVEGNADGATLTEAAEQARHLLEHIRNTGTNIRDLMKDLNMVESTAAYVHRFFNDYVERVFIGDYRELRTREHPLSRRPQILRAVEEIASSEVHRKRLVAWYEAKRCVGNTDRAQRLFQKDLDRISDLRKIDEYLDRLDDEIRRANKRALAYLDYRLRSLRPVDHLVRQCIAAADAARLPKLGDPFAAGEMMSGERLAEPRKLAKRVETSNLRRQVPSEAEIARAHTMLRAREARTVTSPKLTEFVRATLGNQGIITNDAIPLASVADIRAYQTLASVGLAMSANSRRLQLTAMVMARGFRVRKLDAPETEGKYISSVPFMVETRDGAGKNRKSGEKE